MKQTFALLTLLTCNTFYAKNIDVKSMKLYNESAYITSQCYTKTKDENGKLHNPCFSCHTKNKIPNYTLYDDDNQESYAFPSSALTNPWTNLFKDRTNAVNAISDEEILKYVREDNYMNNNKIILQNKLKHLPKEWDFNDNGVWDGYIPDCYFHFDKEGFDKKPDGSYTGWRAFAYYPFLGTFWPTNGSTDDVLIRLDKAFMQNGKGIFDKNIYKLNLSIVESLIKQKDIFIEPTDEKLYGVDLNQNGKLDIAKKIVFHWEVPKYNPQTTKITHFSMSYVGLAKELLQTNKFLIAPGLYPLNTEFLHTVRYIDIDKNGQATMAPRLKELRYARKDFWYTYFHLSNSGMEEVKEQSENPDDITNYYGNVETGLNNKLGWYYQSFIEDAKGDLRPQNYEETLYCMGCHSNLGATADSSFVFQRKFEKGTFQDGWYHWSQKGFRGIADLLLPNGKTEYINYLRQNSSGDEFRANTEVQKKFFTKDLEPKEEELAKIKHDISYLLLPSKERALQLDKAYKVIVDEQSYIYGRDGHIKPLNNVYKKLKDGQSTGLQKINNF